MFTFFNLLFYFVEIGREINIMQLKCNFKINFGTFTVTGNRLAYKHLYYNDLYRNQTFNTED